MIHVEPKQILRKICHAFGCEISRRWKFDPRPESYYVIAPLVDDYLRKRTKNYSIINGGAGGRTDFFSKIWRGVGSDISTIYGFELDPAECERLNRNAKAVGLNARYYPAGLMASTGRATFYITNEIDGSSFYPPNEALIRRWRYSDGKNLGDMLTVERQIEVDVTTIEDWMAKTSVAQIDFIRLNVQGAEFEILQGAGNSLNNVMGLEIEMAFSQTYKGVPLFSQVDQFLRGKGFQFFDMLVTNYVGRDASPISSPVSPWIGGFRWPNKQLFEGQFLYLRDPINSDLPNYGQYTDAHIMKLVAIAELYGQVEFAFELLGWLRDRLLGSDQLRDAEEVGAILNKSRQRYSSMK